MVVVRHFIIKTLDVMLINFTFRSWCSSQKSFWHCQNCFPIPFYLS